MSQAINDGDISHEEFTLINGELKKFKDLKEKIRSKTSTALQKLKSDTDIEKEIETRVEARVSEKKKEIIKKLGN